MRTRICHVTSVHVRSDTRIMVKECRTLAEQMADFEVHLVVADGKGDAKHEGVQIHDIGKLPANRLKRGIAGNLGILRRVRALKPQVVHFHDPELLPLGIVLRMMGYRVVYDVHEDVPRDILTKEYLAQPLRQVVSRVAEVVEWFGGRLLSGIVAATPVIARRFPARKTVCVQNFPILGELRPASGNEYLNRPSNVAYVGAIAEIRCSHEMVQSLADTEATLLLGGKFSPPTLETELQAMPSYDKVRYFGFVDRTAMANILENSRAGLVLFKARPNYDESQPNKLFEYMSAGIPVIASNFPAWERFVAEVDAGLMVDPDNPAEIGKAIAYILQNPARAKQMGENGRKAVEERFNWNTEGRVLVDFYRRMLA